MKKIIYLVSITWIMLLSSCSDVLDITPTDRYPDPAVWQDENLLKMFVNEQYSGICTKDNYYKIIKWEKYNNLFTYKKEQAYPICIWNIIRGSLFKLPLILYIAYGIFWIIPSQLLIPIRDKYCSK